MKKFWLVLACFLLLGGCTAPVDGVISGWELLGVEDAVRVEMDGGDAWGGADVCIEDPDVLRELTDMVCSLSYTRGKKYVPATGCGYEIAWYDANRKLIASAELRDTAILFGDYFYDVVEKSIDTDYLDDLLAVLEEAG